MAVEPVSDKERARRLALMNTQMRKFARFVLADPRVAAWNPDEHSEPLSPAEVQEMKVLIRQLKSWLQQIALPAWRF